MGQKKLNDKQRANRDKLLKRREKKRARTDDRTPAERAADARHKAEVTAAARKGSGRVLGIGYDPKRDPNNSYY